jgi:hypothetical protein
MAIDVETPRNPEPELREDFASRLDSSLARADRERRRHLIIARLQALLPIVLLVGPIVGWRLMLASPDGPHVTINALAWIAFLLDVGVHLDTTLLASLGLQALPSIVGVLIFILVTATLLGQGHEGK